MKRINASGGESQHAHQRPATSMTENVAERDVRETEGASGESRTGAEREEASGSECSGDKLSETEQEEESDSGRRELNDKQVCPPGEWLSVAEEWDRVIGLWKTKIFLRLTI